MAKKVCRSNIGGQALLEGVMMKGASSMASAVRNPDGIIVVETERFRSAKEKNFLYRTPIIRGVINFFSSMVSGIKVLINSAAVYGDIEAEPTKFEKWLSEKTKIDIMVIAVTIGLVLGLGLSIFLFFLVPQFLTSLIGKIFTNFSISHPVIFNLIEGAIRILIFVGYIALVTLMKDIKRTFMYHGAEHKVISCYEHGLELNVENAKKMTRIHDRCGTTFMFLVMIISIILYAVIDVLLFSVWGLKYNIFSRILSRLILLPLVAGISYEFLKLFAKSDNIIFKIFKLPGLLLQKLTTKEPTDDMLEVSLTAFKTVMKMEEDKSIPIKTFEKQFINIFNELKKKLEENHIEPADFDWMICKVMNVKRAEIPSLKLISKEQEKQLRDMVDKRISGQPVQYIIGDTEFYGLKIKVDKRVLIPRLDTESVCEECIKTIKENNFKKVLDLCTGSGVIAITLAKNTETEIVATDDSDDALAVAKENAELNNVNIKFKNSDMFIDLGEEKFDLIVSNPPYISEEDLKTLSKEVKDFEPEEALFGGVDGLDFYRIISENAADFLNDKGYLILEIGSTQAESVKKLLNSQFSNIEVLKDLSGNDRIIKAQYLEK